MPAARPGGSGRRTFDVKGQGGTASESKTKFTHSPVEEYTFQQPLLTGRLFDSGENMQEKKIECIRIAEMISARTGEDAVALAKKIYGWVTSTGS